MLYEDGLTPGTFDLAMRVVRYTETRVSPSDATCWLAKHSMGATIRHLIDAGVEAKKIENAIANDKPLKVKLAAE
jgi:hypothetical protein